jgi:hypothetical protein
MAALDAAIGREAGLQGSPREGPESAPKRPFRCEHEAALTALLGRSFTRSALDRPRPKVPRSVFSIERKGFIRQLDVSSHNCLVVDDKQLIVSNLQQINFL